jgi:hypothetical protein
VGVAAAATVLADRASADASIKILIPSDDSCAAYVTAMNSDDYAAMLNMGGWALGYWSALAEQTDKDILRNTTSEALLDKLATDCQAQPNGAISSFVAEIGRALIAGQTP